MVTTLQSMSIYLNSCNCVITSIGYVGNSGDVEEGHAGVCTGGIDGNPRRGSVQLKACVTGIWVSFVLCCR